MPLILAHGQPKSGSTFLFEIAKWAVAHANGFPPGEFAEKFSLEPRLAQLYIEQPTADIVDAIEERLPEGKYYVIKTHGTLNPAIRARILNRTLLAFTSFRDPRDCIVSLLDAGMRDRAMGGERGFSRVLSVKDALKRTKFAWKNARDWANCKEILKIPYYLTVTDRDLVVTLICEHIGLGMAANAVQAKFKLEQIKKISQFNVGVADRFLDALSPADVAKATLALENQIRKVDQLTERWMTEFGHRAAYELIHTRREERLARILNFAT